MNFDERLKFYKETINNELEKYLKPKYPEIIYNAMNYSVKAGGKRLRPVIALAVCETLGGDIADALPFACGLEMIHTYSLIHDDLPALDNDDLRRGMPTNHKKFGEDIAILAGDALLNKAYEVMAGAVVKNTKYASALKVIADYAGTHGMIVGQVVDVISEGKEISPETLLYIHENKTSALIKASFMAGGITGGADKQILEMLEKAGYYLGMAFQIMDDILDVTSTEEVLGKPIGSDEKNNKATYVSLFSMEKAQKDYEEYSNRAFEIAEQIQKDGFIGKYIKVLSKRIK